MNRYFFTYMSEFEEAVLKSTFSKDRFIRTARQTNDNLVNIAYSIGWEIETDVCGAIDYYGFIKRSTGLVYGVEEMGTPVVLAKVVNFQSLRMQDLIQIDSKLVAFFPEYKNVILTLRGFNRR